MAPSPPSSPPPMLGIAKTAHKCAFCPLGFSSALSRHRHMMAMHASNNPLLAPSTRSEPLPSSGSCASAQAASAAVTADEEVGDGANCAGALQPASTNAGGEGTSAGPATRVPVPGTEANFVLAASSGTGLTVTAAAAAFVNESAEDIVARRHNDGVARGRIAGPRPLAGAVRHVLPPVWPRASAGTTMPLPLL